MPTGIGAFVLNVVIYLTIFKSSAFEYCGRLITRHPEVVAGDSVGRIHRTQPMEGQIVSLPGSLLV